MSKKKIHVLLIEDDPDDYLLTQALFNEMEGYEVTLDWAANYADGNRKSQQGDHDVILVDYRLGQHSGLEFLQSAINQCAAPIIFLTGQEDHAIDVAAARAGAADYLVKTDIDAALLERSIRYSMEHKRVEIAWRNVLRENNRLATAITSLPIGVIISDPMQHDNPVIFVNPAFTTITGYSMMEAVGHNCRFLQGRETSPETVSKIREAIADARSFQGPVLNYCKNGRPFWNELRMQPIFNDGVVVNFVGLMHDVTSRMQTEQNNRDLLRSQSERVNEMTALHGVARILQDEATSPEVLLQAIVEKISLAFEFPERMAARLTMGEQEYSTPHYHDDKYSLSSSAQLSNGCKVRLEVVYKSDHDEARPFMEEERSLLQSSVEMLCSRWERDLARSALEEAHAQLEARVAKRTLELQLRTNELRESEDRLRKINREILELSHLKFPPQAATRQVLGAFNEAAVRSMDIERASTWLYNETRDVLRCVDFFDKATQAHGGGAEAGISELPNSFSALEDERTLAITDAASDPRVQGFYSQYLEPFDIASLLLAPIIKDGIIIGIFSLSRIKTVRDWTLEDQIYAGSLADLIALKMETLELQKTEESLLQATLEAQSARHSAEDANSAKSEFLSRMSHELRTPLNSILGFGQLLQRDKMADKQHERVGLIVTAGRHLLALINEVLDIARVEAGHMTLSIEPVQLDAVIQEALSMIAPLAARHNIDLINETLKNPDFGNLFTLADRQKLHQVLLNLLSNAVKYNRENGYVRVTCEETPDHQICLSIANTGHGIAPENLERAFVPFERLDADESGAEGTGLGLALVKRLVEAMSGTIEARSTHDHETVFTITLPIASAPTSAPREVFEKVLILPPQEKLTVLYIEDNLTNVKLIENVFSDMQNVRLMTTIQGRLGLEMAREHQPNLILLDLHLPDIGGDEVLASLKAEVRTRDIPVVIVSADATPSRQKQLYDQGAFSYLTKPLDIELFLSVFNNIVKNQSSKL